MAINFSVGDRIIVKRDYVNNTLRRLTQGPNLKRTINALLGFGSESLEVTDTGTIDLHERGNAVTRSYIRGVPIDEFNVNYQGGNGVVMYFDSDTLLNNSFEFSTAYLCDICARRVLNNSGVDINKFDVVRYTGFDVATQLPTVALASASALSTNAVMGMAEEDIVDGEQGSVLIEGGISGLDTSAFSAVNDTVFLSDTPGEYSATAGTTSSIVGRVHTVGMEGSISIKGELPFGEGPPGGTGIQGVTGTQGLTGIQGNTGTGVQGDTGIAGETGIQGFTGLALGATGIQGIQGDTGVEGVPGTTGLALGSTGITGVTGLASGPQGETGIQGIAGTNGTNGTNGAQGATGVAGPGFTSFNTSAATSASINAFPTRSSSTTINTGISNPRFWFFSFGGVNVPGGSGAAIDTIITSGASINTSTGQITVNYGTNDLGDGFNNLTTNWHGGAAS